MPNKCDSVRHVDVGNKCGRRSRVQTRQLAHNCHSLARQPGYATVHVTHAVLLQRQQRHFSLPPTPMHLMPQHGPAVNAGLAWPAALPYSPAPQRPSRSRAGGGGGWRLQLAHHHPQQQPHQAVQQDNDIFAANPNPVLTSPALSPPIEAGNAGALLMNTVLPPAAACLPPARLHQCTPLLRSQPAWQPLYQGRKPDTFVYTG